jgi:hypothetical protein
LDAEIRSLKAHLNTIEQYNCSWSVLILGLPLSPDEEKSPDLVKHKVFTNVILPILEGATAAGASGRSRPMLTVYSSEPMYCAPRRAARNP